MITVRPKKFQILVEDMPKNVQSWMIVAFNS